MSGDLVLYEVEGHVARITLNSPARLNALAPTMFGLLAAAWKEADADSNVRVIIFTGNGRGFCAGGDVVHLTDLANDDGSDPNPPIADFPPFTPRAVPIYKPVITAVNGLCVGAGMMFVAESDIVIASDKAVFIDPHVNIGQVGALEPISLLRKMPLERVLRMVILGRGEKLDAEAAQRAGLVTEVVPHDLLLERANELALIAAAGSPVTIQKSLRAIWESFDHPVTEALERGDEIIREHRANHPDCLEGVAAFREKRDPVWTVET